MTPAIFSDHSTSRFKLARPCRKGGKSDTMEGEAEFMQERLKLELQVRRRVWLQLLNITHSDSRSRPNVPKGVYTQSHSSKALSNTLVRQHKLRSVMLNIITVANSRRQVTSHLQCQATQSLKRWMGVWQYPNQGPTTRATDNAVRWQSHRNRKFNYLPIKRFLQTHTCRFDGSTIDVGNSVRRQVHRNRK